MMRRDLLLGAGCVAAVATAETLRPRRRVSLLAGRDLETIIPEGFDGWRSEGASDLVVPRTPGSLASTLYAQTVGRRYRRGEAGPSVMLLAAYGDSQSDLLQLHRPEICYQAVGYAISDVRHDPVRLTERVSLPSVELAARSGSQYEDVLYWTRLGEYLPINAGEQRRDRLRTAMRGYIADGILVRVSMIRDGEPRFDQLAAFSAALVRSVAPADRAVLIGTERARALA